MTTYVTFTQPTDAPFQFQATLDGNAYTVKVPWNMYGRYYVDVLALDGTPIVSQPRIASPLGYDVNLVAGYFFNSTLVWREQNNQFEINP